MTDGSNLFARLWNMLLVGLGVQPEPLIFFLLASFVLAGAGFTVFALQRRRAEFESREALVLFTFGFVALLTGYISGNSRETVTGDVLPVLLGGLGALFMLGVVQDRIDRSFLAVAVLGFALFTFMGLNIGAAKRVNAELELAADAAQATAAIEAAANRLEAAAKQIEAAAGNPALQDKIDWPPLTTPTWQPWPAAPQLPTAPVTAPANPPAKPDCDQLTDPVARMAAGCRPVYLIGGNGPIYIPAPPSFDLWRQNQWTLPKP